MTFSKNQKVTKSKNLNKEYIAIVQNINYLYDKKYKGKDYCHYYSGNAYNQTDRSYMYIFINNGFDIIALLIK